MSLARPLLVLVIVLAACLLSTRFSEHHGGENADAFNVLYAHVVPAVLVRSQVEGPELRGESETGDEGQAEPDEGVGHGEEHAVEPLLAVTLPGFLQGLGHPDHDHELVATNLQIFQIAAVLLIFVCFSGVPAYLRSGRGDAISRLAAGFCLYIRDEMVVPVMGEKLGRKCLPYFLAVFFFILFCNLMGLVPGSATATASIFVTAGMAATTFVTMIACGLYVQGPVQYWKNLVPPVPAFLWPLLFLVELLGLVIKPFALMIRLFANMTGGHLVVLSFVGLIFFFAGASHSPVAWGIAPVAVGFAVFIMIIEAFVALLQAYIFTQLSIYFVGASLHSEH